MRYRHSIPPVLRLSVASVVAAAGCVMGQTADAFFAPLPPDSAAILWQDTLATGRPARPAADSGAVKIVRRDYQYREQVRLALFMMGFIAVMLTATQTWNPD